MCGSNVFVILGCPCRQHIKRQRIEALPSIEDTITIDLEEEPLEPEDPSLHVPQGMGAKWHRHGQVVLWGVLQRFWACY